MWGRCSSIIIIVAVLFFLCDYDKGISQKPCVPKTGGIPVLMFHRVVNGKAKNKYEINTNQFELILKVLKEKRFCPVGIDEITQGKFRKECLGKRLFSITFDDAHISQLRFFENGELDPKCAVGILMSNFKNPKATFFINVCNGGPPFGTDSEKKIKFLIEKGMTIGNHTATHKRLDKLSNSELIQELGDVFLFLNKIGYKWSDMFLAYPYGIPLNEKDIQILKGFTYHGRGYCITTAFSARLGYGEKRPNGETDEEYPLLCPIGGSEEFERRKYNLPRINLHSLEDLIKDVIENKGVYIYSNYR